MVHQWNVRVLLNTVTVCVVLLLCISTPSKVTAQLVADTCMNFDTAGWTTPKGDIFLEVGNTLEIFCHLNPQAVGDRKVAPDSIVFYESEELVDSRFVKVLNATTARLHINEPIPKKHVFFCKLNHTSYLSNSLEVASPSHVPDQDLVCMNEVFVGTRPKEVLNFSCTSYNWEVLNCTWTPPVNSIPTEYKIQYETPKRAGRGQTHSCPTDDDVKRNFCVWTQTSSPSYRKTFEYLTFTLTGENKLGTMKQTIKVHNYAHVVPAAPKFLSVVSKTSSSVYLEWEIGALQFFEKGLAYKVEYVWNKAPDWVTRVYEQKDVEKRNDVVQLNVTGLQYPNVPYDFRVYMKSAIALGDSGWSEPASVVTKTAPCAPYKAPKTDVGSFEVSHELANYRTIFIYWNQIPAIEHNGDEFRYEVSVVEDAVERIGIKPEVLTSTYAKFTNMSYNECTFRVTSVNAKGSSTEVSTVRVPSKRNIIPDPVVFTKIDYGNGVYELAWKQPNLAEHDIHNFTIFWCENNRERPYQCDGYTDWMHESSTSRKRNVTVNPSKAYQFAISANSGTSSSGMVWAACTVLHDKISKMKNVWVNKVGSYFIDIKWKLECSERVDRIQGFHIYYCVTWKYDRTKCAESEKTLTVYGDVTTNHGNVTNLKPQTHYKIQVSIFVQDGRIGPRSDELHNSTLDGAPNVEGLKVEAFNITNTAAEIRWEAPVVTNGVLQYYRVHYNDDVVVVNRTQVTLTNLTSYHHYNVRVEACTSYCAEMDPIGVNTKIGMPGLVSKPTAEAINSSHAMVTWDPPLVPAGPNPVYDVRMLFDEVDKNSTVSVIETSETRAVVAIPKCKGEGPRLSYTFYVRAKNFDDSDYKSQHFLGDWSSAYSINCIHTGLSTLWKVMLGISLFVLFLSVFVFWGRKGVYKCQQMKNVEVTLPQKFTIPPLFHCGDVKENEYHVNIRSWSDAGNTESDHLNSKLTDLDQSSIDCIDLDLDTDRETDKSSSGCYTG